MQPLTSPGKLTVCSYKHIPSDVLSVLQHGFGTRVEEDLDDLAIGPKVHTKSHRFLEENLLVVGAVDDAEHIGRAVTAFDLRINLLIRCSEILDHCIETRP